MMSKIFLFEERFTNIKTSMDQISLCNVIIGHMGHCIIHFGILLGVLGLVDPVIGSHQYQLYKKKQLVQFPSCKYI